MAHARLSLHHFKEGTSNAHYRITIYTIRLRVSAIKAMLTEGLISSLIDGIMAVTTLILMFVYSPMLAAIALGAWFIITLNNFYKPKEYEEWLVLSNEEKYHYQGRKEMKD